MKKLLKISIILVSIALLIGCSNDSIDKNEQAYKNKEIENHTNEITELKKELESLQQEMESIRKTVEDNMLLKDTVINLNNEVNKLRAVIENLPGVEIKLAYINNIKEENETIEFKVDFITWITGEGDDFPNGFKIINETEENKSLYVSLDTPVYIIDSMKQKNITLKSFIEGYKNQQFKTPYRLYIIENKIILIEEQYVP